MGTGSDVDDCLAVSVYFSLAIYDEKKIIKADKGRTSVESIISQIRNEYDVQNIVMGYMTILENVSGDPCETEAQTGFLIKLLSWKI
jgi:hypothetical protein